MAGKRINDVTLGQQLLFDEDLLILVDKTGLLEAKAMSITLLGNTYFQGSEDGIIYHNEVTALDTYYRFSTDGGSVWTDFLVYTDEQAQDSIGTILSNEFTYDDGTPAISLNYTNISHTSLQDIGTASHADIDTHISGDGSDHTYIDQDVTSGSSPTFSGVNITDIDCSNVNIDVIGSPTYTTQCDFNKMFGSSGRGTGGSITDAGGETINVAAGTGFIKATDDDTADLLSFNWSASNGLSIPTDTIRYIGIHYNSGSPAVTVKTSYDWDLDTEFPLGTVVNEGGTLQILNNPWWVTDGLTNILERFNAEGSVVYDKNYGGLILSVTGTRNVAVTAGRLWALLNEFNISALDTSVTGTFEYYWYNGVAGTWTASDVSQYSVTQWNDTTQATLQTLSNNYYAVLWVYAEADSGEISILYPQAEYSNLSVAEQETPPTLLPSHISNSGVLIGRIVIKQNTTAPSLVESAFTQTFVGTASATHNNLSGLQGGTTGEYYHLTSAQYSGLNLTNWDTAYTHSQATTGNPHSIGFDDITTGNWKIFYSNGSGVLTELSLGTSGQVLTANGATSAPTFETPSSGVTDHSLLSNLDYASAGHTGFQAALTFGILNTNSVVIDSASVADDEYARFTASGLESRSVSEVKTDLSLDAVENTALSTWTGSTNITTLGTIGTGTWQGTAIGDSYISSAATWNAKVDVATGTARYMPVFSDGDTITNSALYFDVSSNFGFGTDSPNQKVTIEGTMSLKEQAAANTDTAAYGQIWVKSGTTNSLWFTDDAGTDFQLSLTADTDYLTPGGPLGTPSSGTLTNCSGLPVSGITASTSTALGVGSIELGHASDTTIARVSAGVISVEGITVPTISSTSTFTNKTLTSNTNILGGVTMALGSDATGDVYYRDASGYLTRLGIGTSGQVLKVNSGLPSWQDATGGGDVSVSGTPLDSHIAVWTNGTTIEGTSSLTYDGSNLQLTGDIGSTGTKITKGWFTDLEVVNAIAGSITGNAATVTNGLYTTNIGSSVQAYDAGLTNLAGVSMAADKFYYTTADNTHAAATVTSFGRSILDDADAATVRTTLGLVIGTNVQAYSTYLNTIAGLSRTDGNFIVGNGTTWVAESGSTVRTSLGLGSVENTALSTWAGTTNITTLGTVTTGTLSTGTVLGGVTVTLGSDATGDTYYRSAGGVLTRLGIGSASQVLTVSGGLPSWQTATTVATDTIWDAKGDLAVGTGSNTAARLAIGTNGQYLVADSGETTGLRYIGETVDLGFACSDETTDLETGQRVAIDCPYDFTVTRVYASVTTAPVGAAITIDVEDEGTTILNAVVSISASANNGETSTFTGSASSYAFSKGDLITIDIDQVGSTTAGAGLVVHLIGVKTV